MATNLSEKLTAQFYDWEIRGRGWYAFPVPVYLEPHFVPFLGHYIETTEVIDDSKRPGILGSLLGFNKPKPVKEKEKEPPIYAIALDDKTEPLSVITISFPKDEIKDADSMERLLTMLSYTERPISFELIADGKTIAVQLCIRECDTDYVQSQVRAYFPTAILGKGNQDALNIVVDGLETSCTDFGLGQEFMRPLAVNTRFNPDPYIGLFGALDSVREGERVILQFLISGTTYPWVNSITRSVSDGEGGSFLADAPEMLKYTKEKVASPLCSVAIRLVSQASTKQRCTTIIDHIAVSLIELSRSTGNSLMNLHGIGYPSPAEFIDSVLLRETHRVGMLLNSKELVNLVHFPNIVSSKLTQEVKRTKRSAVSIEHNDLFLGKNIHQGQAHNVYIANAQRLRHMHIIGATGTGKSTFLLNIINEDILAGRGVGVLDPHGDLIEAILERIPKERHKDVVLIDPADADYPVGFNILTAHTEIEKEQLSSDLVATFKRLSTSWGDQMNSVFANAILAFLESSEGGTLSDLRRFLIEPVYRNQFLKTVQDPNITYYWQHTYPHLKTSSLGPILTRLDSFLRPKLIRNMVMQKKGIDFEQVMDGNKILLVKLSQGLIGIENSYLLGTLIVSKIYQAATARQAKANKDRNDFFLYVDEFQNFITPSMSAILSGARKYHLGLILAHQDMMQVQKFDTELASSVIANPGTRVCFRLGDIDAKKFADGFSFFTAEDLQNLKTGEAIMRIERPDNDFNLTVSQLQEVEQAVAEENKQALITLSRETYSKPKEEVEQLQTILNAPAQVEEVKAAPPKSPAPGIPSVQKKEPVKTTSPKVETQHRYLQTLIKKMAEARGFKAAIEETTPDGKGRIDVALTRGEKKIAVEVSVTTSDTWEVHNAEKCLNAGYSPVIVCSSDVKNLEKIRKQIHVKLTEGQGKNILVFEPEDVFKYLDTQLVEEYSSEKIVKGYRVKVEYSPTDENEMKNIQINVIQKVSESVRKMK